MKNLFFLITIPLIALVIGCELEEEESDNIPVNIETLSQTWIIEKVNTDGEKNDYLFNETPNVLKLNSDMSCQMVSYFQQQKNEIQGQWVLDGDMIMAQASDNSWFVNFSENKVLKIKRLGNGAQRLILQKMSYYGNTYISYISEANTEQ